MLENKPLGKYHKTRREWNWVEHSSFWSMLNLIY